MDPHCSVASAARRPGSPKGLSKRSTVLSLHFLSCQPELPADTTHRSLRLNEIGLANVVPGFLLQHNHSELLGNRFIRSPGAQWTFHIMLVETKKTGADFSIRSQPEAIAMAAKWFGHWRDNSDFGVASGDTPAARRFRRIRVFEREQIESRLQFLQRSEEHTSELQSLRHLV